jgi:hypothetical protein
MMTNQTWEIQCQKWGELVWGAGSPFSANQDKKKDREIESDSITAENKKRRFQLPLCHSAVKCTEYSNKPKGAGEVENLESTGHNTAY